MPVDAARPRAEVPSEYCWRPQHLVLDDEAWDEQYEALCSDLPMLSQCSGQLHDPRQLLGCLDQLFELRRRLALLSSYAHRRHDEDMSVGKYQALRERVEKLTIQLDESSAFVEPELCQMADVQLSEIQKRPELCDYNRYINGVQRRKAHILSVSEEKLMASLSLTRDNAHSAYSAFSGADLRFDPIRINGQTIQLTQAEFSRYRASCDRKLRKAAFEQFFGTFFMYRNTLAALLSGHLNANVVFARARKFESALESALYPDELPRSVYEQMNRAVRSELPTLHRYLNVRRKLLGVDELHYYDLYAPIVQQDVALTFDYSASVRTLVEALRPLGADYVADLAEGLALENGWIDVYPNKGKRTGAYMDGSAYGVHPFVLCNHLDDLNSLSTLAHEMGHAMHTFYTNRKQPFAKADYSIFVAEVASTVNEALLGEYLLSQASDDRVRLYLLGQQLEGFRQTLFRQAMFAEFEAAAYERVESGAALTADDLSHEYLSVARAYYGHPDVVTVDDRYGIEWAYVPHFYYNFYVFQYATGIVAATALASAIRETDSAKEAYRTGLLEAGCATSPVDTLRNAGVDLTSKEPYEVTGRVFDRTISEVESVAARISSLD